jgi:hypothetical protein
MMRVVMRASLTRKGRSLTREGVYGLTEPPRLKRKSRSRLNEGSGLGCERSERRVESLRALEVVCSSSSSATKAMNAAIVV